MPISDGAYRLRPDAPFDGGGCAGKSRRDAGQELPRKDVSKALSNARAAEVHAVRDSVLFTYSGLMTNDSDVFRVSAELMAAGKDLKVELKKTGV